MHMIESSNNLIHEELKMFPGEFLITFQNLMQISIHELEHDINMVEILSCHWHYYRFKVDNILVF